MSSAQDPTSGSKVVDLGQRQDPRNERLGDLLLSVRGIALKRLQALVGTLFDNVDDALFDLAEKAENNAAQTQYFDGMREVRKKRPLVERLFVEQVTRGIGDFATGRSRAPRPADTPSSGTAAAELSLVDDSELEESLAITSMVGKAESRLARALFAVNQRLSVISGGNKVEDATNPIGPAMLGQALRGAMRELAVEVRVKLIIYKLFDRYVMGGLDALYDEVNAELVRSGVLPQLRHGVQHRPGMPAAGQPEAAAGAAHAAGGEAYLQESADLQAELFQTVTALLAARRGMVRGGAAQSYGGAASLSPAELLGALTLLQSQTATLPLPANLPAEAYQSELSAVQHLKDQLMGQIAQLSGEAKARVSGADEDTIDLVGMLFEYILQDRNLPAQMQVLLARLQIPYLKVAILDRKLFAHKTHPARRLLDALADAAKGWSEESDRDHRLLDKVRSTVEALLRDFDDDLDIFPRLLADFQTFNEAHRRRAELAEQRAAEATRGREKLQEARRRAAREILSRIEGRDLPALIHGVLTRPWANYLVLTLLRQGEGSQEFRSALQFVDDFVASAAPMPDEEARNRLRALLPQIEKALRHGLATVAFHENDVKRLMAELSAFYRRQLGLAAEGDAPDAGAAQAQAVPIPDSVEPITAIEEDTTELAEPRGDAPALRAARELKVGTWLELTDEQGVRERAKLSWISPISGRYLFVNRRGLKVADKTAQQIAAEIEAGTAVVLEEVPLFDRALDAIVERLRQAQAERQAPSGA
ncbi:hypothetical protein MBSD_n0273 [Mizugakiibacter sediminis]|uniref:Thymidine phosphorylase n=1 Tax=Mizugakiibacter sediminis TaxID=1475481 RepID=A0A0K8QJ67_9GAMM|nr:DUF1631 domain-containing protein [Mizugakiibacter sediminis]GAP64985.1 hypothetical protein MBSD_n0273 [Mizugakiibacter sediminis]